MADIEDLDFIEVEISPNDLTYGHLMTHCCQELAINPQYVERIR